MRTIFLVIGALSLAHLALLQIHPVGAVPPPVKGALDIGVVFDVGGRGDKSFNDGAYKGAEKAMRDYGARVHFIEPGDGADREAGLRLLAAEKMGLVIGVGFIFTDDLSSLAQEYPDVRFVGGMDIPLIHKFEAGYRAGVRYVCPDCTVLVQYAGVTPDAFRNPSKGKELALSQYEQGVNIIFHASGSTGLGVFEAARQTKKLAIGVDADQYDEAPGFILTSMVKGVDAVVYDQIGRVRDGTFHGGIYEYGLAENGVGWIYDAHNRALIPDSVKVKLDSLRALIIAGKIAVPSTR